MMKKLLIGICILLFVVSEICLLRQINLQRDEIDIKDEYMSSILFKYYATESMFENCIKNVGSKINQDVCISDTLGNNVRLADIVSSVGGMVLVCRFSERNCGQCVDHAIRVVMDNVDSIDVHNLIFICDYTNKRTLHINENEYCMKQNIILNCDNLGIPAEKEKLPYYFVIDSSLCVRGVYFPNRRTHGTDFDYKHVKLLYDKLIKGK